MRLNPWSIDENGSEQFVHPLNRDNEKRFRSILADYLISDVSESRFFGTEGDKLLADFFPLRLT